MRRTKQVGGRLSPRNLVICGVLIVCVASAVAVLAIPERVPHALARPSEPTTAVVTSRALDDARVVRIVSEGGSSRSLTSVREGLLTALSCSQTEPLRSGQVVARVDGEPLMALATSTPLWRDIVRGDHGADVRALQSELARLGHGVAVDGVAGRYTIEAVRSVGGVDRDGIIRRDSFVWIPAASIRPKACVAKIGTRVVPGDELVALDAGVESLVLEEVPQDAVPGDRSVTVGSTRVRTNSDGTVTDPVAVQQLVATPEYRRSETDERGRRAVDARWELAEPLQALVVPPASVWRRNGATCVTDTSGKAVRVDVVGSELGQTFVRAEPGKPIVRVMTRPSRAAQGRC